MVLGVRNMVPMLGLPVVAPAVEAELTGVLPILRSQRLVATTKHSGHPSGTNANFKARRGKRKSQKQRGRCPSGGTACAFLSALRVRPSPHLTALTGKN